MTAREVFQAALDAEKEIRNIQRRKQHYLDMATGMSGMSETVIRSQSGRSRVEKAALELVDLADRLDREAEQYTAAVKRAEDLIGKLKKPRHREVLELRYLAGHSWRTVADEMDYQDIKSAFRVHGWALLEAQKILNGG